MYNKKNLTLPARFSVSFWLITVLEFRITVLSENDTDHSFIAG